MLPCVLRKLEKASYAAWFVFSDRSIFHLSGSHSPQSSCVLNNYTKSKRARQTVYI